MKSYPKKVSGKPGRWFSGTSTFRANLLFFVLGGALSIVGLIFWQGFYLRGAGPLTEAPANPEWGRLEATPMFLEKPTEFLPAIPENYPPPQWHFAGRTPESVREFLVACGLTSSEALALTGTSVAHGTNGTAIHPQPEQVLGLTPASREKIYAELEKSPDNVGQRNPFRILPGNEDLWFSRAGLPSAKVDLARKLTYLRAGVLCFCDLESAHQIFTKPEFQALLRALYSTDTMLVRLRILPGDSIDRIAAYWGRGGRVGMLRALLLPLASAPGGGDISLRDLLPPLPRAWLNSYPPPVEPGRLSGDCYWTSLNFFARAADDRFLDPKLRSEEFRENYELVPKADRFGDIIVFADEHGITQHACVYLAENLVFTKNGLGRSMPWVVMSLDLIRAIYGNRTHIFRLRGS